ATDALTEALNDSHAELLITFDPSGINHHPDHVATHLATRRALSRLSHPAALAMMTPPPPFCWALGSDFRWDRETTVMTLSLSAAERATKAQVYETYASQWKTLRLLSGGLPPHIFFSLFPAEWYLWLPPDDAAAWARWADSP
ncbi:MAG: PIG-L family deacetylase, partial [Archangium sp.]|nr:PIG-L family deacetylase [Archangium sp.]